MNMGFQSLVNNRALCEDEAKIVIGQTPIPALLIDIAGRITSLNNLTAELLGRSVSELSGSDLKVALGGAVGEPDLNLEALNSSGVPDPDRAFSNGRGETFPRCSPTYRSLERRANRREKW